MFRPLLVPHVAGETKLVKFNLKLLVIGRPFVEGPT